MIRQRSLFRRDADPRFCASVKHGDRRPRAFRILTLGRFSFRLCVECARPYEGKRGARVVRVAEVA